MTRKQELQQEAAAWRKIGNYFATPRGPTWDDFYRCENGWYESLLGVCYQLGRIPRSKRIRMEDAFREMFGKTLSGRARDRDNFWWDRKDRSSRAIACYLMALECEAEAKEVPRRKH